MTLSMKKEDVIPYVIATWGDQQLENIYTAPSTVDGIQQQLDAGNKLITFMINEEVDGEIRKVLKNIKVIEDTKNNEYAAQFGDTNDSTVRVWGHYFAKTIDEALELAKNEHPNLDVEWISEGPSIEVRRQQVEKYGRFFNNNEIAEMNAMLGKVIKNQVNNKNVNNDQ